MIPRWSRQKTKGTVGHGCQTECWSKGNGNGKITSMVVDSSQNTWMDLTNIDTWLFYLAETLARDTSWYMLVKIVESLLSSMIVLMLQKSTTRGPAVFYRCLIAWLTAFGISFPPERWVSLPPGSPGTPPSPQQRGVLYQDGIVKRLLRCGAEKDMPMQQGLKDLAVQSANQGRTCFFLSLALHNIYEYLYGKHQPFSFGSETWCSMCSMYTLGPSVSLPPFYGIFDWSNFSWRNFIFLCSFYRKVGRRETKQIFRIFGYYPFLHRIFWTHFCSAQLYRNQKRVAENKFTFGFLTLISIIENAQEHTNAY